MAADEDLNSAGGGVDLGHPRSMTCGCPGCVIPPPDALETQALVQPAESPFPLSETFRLHSRPSASKRIYLDFDGHTASGTAWGSTIVTPAFSLDPNYEAFSDSELTLIQEIWSRVTEDFVPFDVDVTTEAPSNADLINSGGGDTRWGIRVVVGGNGSWRPGAAGVAFVNGFGRADLAPAFVFADQTWKTRPNFFAACISHEVGHTLGLGHDGYQGSEYYGGRGSWGPLMGNPDRSLTQWSNGDYGGATNQQDDLAVIATRAGNGFGYRPDDHGDTLATATNYVGVDLEGVIGRSNDVDVFSFYTSSRINATINPAQFGANLDIRAELLDASGTVIAVSDSQTSLAATFEITVGRGTYFLRVQGTGQGDPATTGYSRYGSLGQYTVDLTLDYHPIILTAEDRVGTIQGPVPNGGRTNDASPVVRGSGVPGATITLMSGGVTRGTTTADASGAWAIQVSPALSDGTHELTANDSLGGTSSTSFLLTVDTAAPSVAITRNIATPVRAGETTTIFFTFSEVPTDFGPGDIAVSGGSLSTLVGNGVSRTAVFTPTPGFAGTATIGTGSGVFTDAVGNPSEASTLTLQVDTITPTVSIARPSTGVITTGSSTTISFILSAPATNFLSADVTVTGGSLTGFTGAGTSYAAIFIPTAGFQGNGSVAIAAGSFTNASGNPNLAASLVIPIDTAPPTLRIARTDSALLRAGTTATVNFSLSESGTTFSATDVVATGGLLSDFSGSGTSYTATFTPAVGFTGVAVIAVGPNVFTDAAGHPNAATTLELVVDAVSPSIVVTRSGAGTLTVGSTTVLNFTLSEAATDFTAADVIVHGGSLTGFSGTGVAYTATFVPAARFRGSASVTISPGSFTDAFGNPNVNGALSIPVDTLAPSLGMLRTGPATLRAATTSTVTFNLSEPTNDFTVSDVVVVGGSVSDFNGAGATYSAVFTPLPGFHGNATVTVAAAAFTDTAGNTNTAASITIPVDALQPTVLVTHSGGGTLGIGANALLTFTLSEPAVDFSVTDMLVTGGLLTAFSGSGSAYTVIFTPAAMTAGPAVITVPAGTFTDSAGNPNLVTTVSFVVDTVPPTVSITRVGATTLTVGATATVTFRTSESVKDFAVTDVIVDGGSLTEFTGTGTIYTATFTPHASFQGTAAISVMAAAILDAAGNSNLAGARLEFGVDTAAPTITSVRSTQPGSRLGIGDALGLVATISEPVTRGARFALELNSGGIVELVVDGSGTLARGSYTARPGEESSRLDVVTIRRADEVQDAATNSLATRLPPTATGLAAERAIVVDAAVRFITSGPFSIHPGVVADAGGLFRRVTIRFSTPVQGVSVNSFQLTLAGNPVPLAGARLQGAGSDYTLLLPVLRGNPIGIYTLTLRPGHMIRATNNGAKAAERISLHWGYRSSIGMVPSAPSSVTHRSFATAANQISVAISWQTATRNGGGVVTHHVVQYRVAGTNRWITTRDRVPGEATAATITGLVAGRSYEVRVAAQNAAGLGEFALSTVVLPSQALRRSLTTPPSLSTLPVHP